MVPDRLRSPSRPRAAPAVAAVLAVAAAVGGCGPDEGRGSGPTPTVTTGRASSPPVRASWEAGPLAPLSLTEVAAAAHDGQIWVAGGLDADGAAVAAVLVLDPPSGRWSKGPPLPEPVHHSSLVSDGNTLRLVGGYVGSGFDRPTDAVRRLDGDRWIEDGSLPEPRAAGAAAYDGVGRTVYAGGVGPDGVSSVVLVLSDGRWEVVAELGAPREHLAATSDGEGRVFVLGGRRGALDTNVATVETLDAQGLRHIGNLPTARGGVAAFYSGVVGACLVGGEHPGGTNAEVECVDQDGRVTVLPALRLARHGLGAAVLDDVAYALLGGPRPGLFVSDAVESLDLP